MKIRLIFLLVTIITLSCSREKKTEPLEIYSYEDWRSKVKIVDTACINSKQRAKEDINKGKLYYNTKIYKPYDYSVLVKELSTLQIIPDTTTVEDNYDHESGSPKPFTKGCYQHTMNEYILNKHSSAIFDSIITKVEKQYVLDHPDYIFEMNDLDSYYMDKGSEDFNNILNTTKNHFFYYFPYPANYKFDDNKKSKTFIEFILLKDGSVKDLIIKSNFSYPENKKHANYFKEYVENSIRKCKWKPAYSSGLPVNANVKLDFKHK